MGVIGWERRSAGSARWILVYQKIDDHQQYAPGRFPRGVGTMKTQRSSTFVKDKTCCHGGPLLRHLMTTVPLRDSDVSRCSNPLRKLIRIIYTYILPLGLRERILDCAKFNYPSNKDTHIAECYTSLLGARDHFSTYVQQELGSPIGRCPMWH